MSTIDAAYAWRVALLVRSRTLSPGELSRRLGLAPDESSSVDGRRWPHLWLLGSGLPTEATLDQHLTAVVRRCRGREPALADLAARYNCDLTLEAVFRLGSTSVPGMWLSPEVTRFAAACGIGIDIDGYLEDPVDDGDSVPSW